MIVRTPFERVAAAELLLAASEEGGRFRFHLRGMRARLELTFVHGQIASDGRERGTIDQRLMLLALSEGGEIEPIGPFVAEERRSRTTVGWESAWIAAEQRAHNLMRMLDGFGMPGLRKLWPDYHRMMSTPELPDLSVTILRTVDGEHTIAELVALGPYEPEMVVNVLKEMLRDGFVRYAPARVPSVVDAAKIRPPSRPLGLPSPDEYTGAIVRRDIQHRLSVVPSASSSQVIDQAFSEAFLPASETHDRPKQAAAPPPWFWRTAVGALLVGVGLALAGWPPRLPDWLNITAAVPTSTISVSLQPHYGRPLRVGDRDEAQRFGRGGLGR